MVCIIRQLITTLLAITLISVGKYYVCLVGRA